MTKYSNTCGCSSTYNHDGHHWYVCPKHRKRPHMRLTPLLAALSLSLFMLSQAGLILGYLHINDLLFGVCLCAQSLALIVYFDLERNHP